MATIYTPETNKSLNDFIEDIINKDSTIVIPDLQRPYIWNPDQVIKLVDSIFKKWPFGALLCWNVKIKDGIHDYIPYRPFWQDVVRDVPYKNSKEASVNKNSNSFLMILDGQQRIQSLLLALGGDSWGFTLTDKEWKKNIEGKEESINTNNWTTGCLCLDTEIFLSEYIKCKNRVASIDIGKCLVWAVTDQTTGRSSNDKKDILPKVWDTPGKYIRFSKLWNAAEPVGKMPKDYEEILFEKVKPEDDKIISAERIQKYLAPLAEFMMIVSDVKDSTMVTQLIVKDQLNSGIPSKQEYNNAIVNIFARLNSLGRVLTAQEITLAWLKTGWREASENEKNQDKKDCAKELSSLLNELNDKEANTGGMMMSMDDLVDILSLCWAIITKDGKNKDEILPEGKDLVEGEIMKSIGKITYEYWDFIKQAIKECKETFENHKLNECFLRSFSAFNIICGWNFVALISSKIIQGRIRETECRFDTQLNIAFDYFIDKWYFTTVLSGTWSKTDNYKNYTSDLCYLYKSIENITIAGDAEAKLTEILKNWLSKLLPTTISRIEDLRAYNRWEVIGYRNVLWLWNRLEKDRFEVVKKPMKRKYSTPKIEVDHAIPIEIWNKKVEVEYPFVESKLPGTEQEKEIRIDDLDFNRSKLIQWINSIGNCSLLLRSHNRSKKEVQFGDFLKDVYNDDQISEFVRNLKFTEIFLNPNNYSVNEIILEINNRTNIIKSELIDYFNGVKNRVDI